MEAYTLSYVSSGIEMQEKHSEKLEEMREVLVKMEEKLSESYAVIDSIQTLGLGYLFKHEIEAILHHHHNSPKHHPYEPLPFDEYLMGNKKGSEELSKSKEIMSGEVKNTIGENKYKWENLLQEVAIFESTLVESIHKHEILQVVKWWKELGLNKEVGLREQPEKWHMWSMAMLKDPSWSKHRILLTKPISLVYAVDDIFDLHGTIPQLTLFTHAINTWEISAAQNLPGYMKACFVAIQDTTHEISRFVSRLHGWNPLQLLKKEWEKLLNAFLMEAKWFGSGEVPKREEYLKNGVISTGVPMVFAHLYFIMGNPLTKHTQSQLNHPRGITFSVAKILRLLDDLGNAQDEKQEGYDGSYIEYYMREEKVESLEAAREHVMSMVSDTWEHLKARALSPTTPYSASFKKACLDAAKMVPIMYNYDNNHRLPLLEDLVHSKFHDTALVDSILG